MALWAAGLGILLLLLAVNVISVIQRRWEEYTDVATKGVGGVDKFYQVLLNKGEWNAN